MNTLIGLLDKKLQPDNVAKLRHRLHAIRLRQISPTPRSIRLSSARGTVCTSVSPCSATAEAEADDEAEAEAYAKELVDNINVVPTTVEITAIFN